MLALVIIISASITAAALTNKAVTGQNAQNVLDQYNIQPPVSPSSLAPASASSGSVDPSVSVDTAVISAGGTEHHDVTALQVFEANGIVTYEADGFRLIHDTNTGVWSMEWDVKNNLDVPMTIQPYIQLMGCDIRRTGTVPNDLPYLFAGVPEGCPARSPSLNLTLIPANPSAADGTRDTTLVRMSFQTSTLSLPDSSASSNTANNTTVGKSVRNKYLSLHPEANNTRPASNPTELRKSVCSVDSTIGIINGTTIVLQPGESATISSTVNSTDFGFACSPVNHALINYNVQAGNNTYKAYKTDELIVFGKEESNICGS